MPSPPLWCSSTACTPLYYHGEQVLSLLTWVQILRACSIVLLATGLLVLLISWLWHLPWLVRLSGVLPLAGSGFAWGAALHIQDAFGYLLQLEQEYNDGGKPPPSYYPHIEHLMASALHDALVLAWLIVGVTSVLVLASAVGLWRGFLVRNRSGKGQLPKSHLSPPPTSEYGAAR
jgi:hypothetical protein